MTRRVGFGAAAFFLIVASVVGQDSRAALPKPGRVFVLGFDGLDYELTKLWMSEGRLPNLKELSGDGAFGPLMPTTPAQSPVAWSAITTGRNPGETGIDDFLVRDFSHGDVRADLGLVAVKTTKEGMAGRGRRRGGILAFASVLIAMLIVASRKAPQRSMRRTTAVLAAVTTVLGGTALYYSETAIPDGVPVLTNARHGEAFWEILDHAKQKTITVLAPCAFPAAKLEDGHLLCGLGVPDALGSPGTWSHYSDAFKRIETTETGGWRIPLQYENPATGDGPFQPAIVIGPKNMVTGDGARVSQTAAISVDKKSETLTFSTVLGATTMKRGEWSAPIGFEYSHSSLVKTRSFSRAKFSDANGAVSLYIDPPGFDPNFLPPLIKMSEPFEWAAALAKEVGPFETVGWACATNALKDREIDETTFFEDATRVWDEQEKLARAGFSTADGRVYTAIFTVPDRLQHMFIGEPRGDEAHTRPPQLQNVVVDAYRRVDRFVGEVMKRLVGPDDLLIVVSDHGFSEWKRAVNLNTFLVEKGFLVLNGKTGSRSLEADLQSGHAYASVDWQKTRAYSLGLGRIYVNRSGREPSGIVNDADVARTTEEISNALLALRDDGRVVVSRVDRGTEIYHGDAIPNGAAEIYVSFKRGWRVSWASCLGGADEPLFSDNISNWRGDHCSVDPAEVRGVFFANRRIRTETPRAVDVAPTVLDFCGIATDAGHAFNGRSLLAR